MDSLAMLRATGAGLGAALLLALLCTPAAAAPIPFSSQPRDYELQDEPLPSFLRRLFADEGIRLQMSPGVENTAGTLNGPRSGTPAAIFGSIVDSFRLAAYYDGSAAQVWRRDELVSRYFVVQPHQAAAFMAAVDQLGMTGPHNRVRLTEDSGLVSVSGAPPFVDQVAQIAEAVSRRRDPVDTVFRFFALKHAWASDRSFVVGNRQVTVPGVASILQQLLDEGGAAAPALAGDVLLPAAAPSVSSQGLAALGSGQRDPASRVFMPDARGGLRQYERSADTPGAVLLPASRAAGTGVARIVADPYRNAVIVRDLPERIGLYEELIRALDTETAIVEIEATIIDVDTERLRRLGVEWRAADRRVEGVFGGDGSKDDFLNALAAGNVAALGQVPGFQIGAIIGDDERFIARVNALQEEGAMRIVSRPQVATINDVEAVIESSRQLFVPVQGAFQVDLFNVYAGTVLRVTPHRIAEDARERIRLLVTVEDGDVQLTASEVQNIEIPEVTRNSVTTQAVIESGQSLLLGGLIRDAASTTVTKVPLLGDLPLLGHLFRSRARQAERTERLFLISPRILDQQRAQLLPVPVPELRSPPWQPPANLPPPPPPLPPEPSAVWPEPPLPERPPTTPPQALPSGTPASAAAPSPDTAVPEPESATPAAETGAAVPGPLTAEQQQAFTYRVMPARGLYLRGAPSPHGVREAVLAQHWPVTTTGRRESDSDGQQWIEVTAVDAAGRELRGWVRPVYLGVYPHAPDADFATAPPQPVVAAEPQGAVDVPPGGGIESEEMP